MASSSVVIKKDDLTLSQLARYDDLVTDALIDHVYFWTTIRKNRGRYSASRGIKEEDVADIIRKALIAEKDPEKALGQLQELPGLKDHLKRLSTRNEKEQFSKHLRKYVDMYLPEAEFEVSTTNRYDISTEEAAIIARKRIDRGSNIKYLVGIQVQMTEEEVQNLDLTRRDFSIVMSGRGRKPSLFLGPARFANHDCDANARLTIKGINGMEVVARKDIKVGDEITVSYGDDYFGINNCECLCATCEKIRRNGWAITNSDGEKDHSESMSMSMSMSTSDGPPSRTPRSRHASHLFTPSTSRSPTRPQGDHSQNVVNGGGLNVQVCDLSGPQPVAALPQSKRLSSQTIGSKLKEVISADDLLGGKNELVTRANPALSEHSVLTPRKSIPPLASQTVSRTPENLKATESLHRKRKAPGQDVTEGAASNSRAHGSEDEDESSESDADHKKPRRPGDYTLTRALLGTPSSRWVKCQVCMNHFVQYDAYQTRYACSRCERHSKLYGYKWPKTEKVDRYDTEERVTDHRTIGRYLMRHEELSVKKGKKTTEQLRAEQQEREQLRDLGQDDAESDEGDDEDDEAVTPRRSRRKGVAAQYRGPSLSPTRSGKTPAVIAEEAEDSSTSEFLETSASKKRKVSFAKRGQNLNKGFGRPNKKRGRALRFTRPKHKSETSAKSRLVNRSDLSAPSSSKMGTHLLTGTSAQETEQLNRNEKGKRATKRKRGESMAGNDREEPPPKRADGAKGKLPRQPSPDLVSSPRSSSDTSMHDVDSASESASEGTMSTQYSDVDLLDDRFFKKYLAINKKGVRTDVDARALRAAAKELKEKNEHRYNRGTALALEMMDKACDHFAPDRAQSIPKVSVASPARIKTTTKTPARTSVKPFAKPFAKPSVKASAKAPVQPPEDAPAKNPRKIAAAAKARAAKSKKIAEAKLFAATMAGGAAPATSTTTKPATAKLKRRVIGAGKKVKRPYVWTGKNIKTETGRERVQHAIQRRATIAGTAGKAKPVAKPGKLKSPAKKPLAAPVLPDDESESVEEASNAEESESEEIEEVSDDEGWSAELSAVGNNRVRLGKDRELAKHKQELR